MGIADGKLHDLALNFVRGIDAVALRNLVDYFGSPEAVFDASEQEINAIEGIGRTMAAVLKSSRFHAYERAREEIDFAEQHNIQLLTFSDRAYPIRLKKCYDPPPILSYRGGADLNALRIVSIVGSRKATVYGENSCRELVEGLKDYGVVVVSGLEYGIGCLAHQASLDHKIPTIGVLAHGLDRIYPARKKDLANEMLQHGGLLSEFPSGSAPEPQNFPLRNRIIAGMADVLVVVEAGIQSSALVTADIANSYNRDVCAFPGNIYQNTSSGCNFLIKSHCAHLISRAKDIAYLMNWDKVVPSCFSGKGS